VVSVATARGTVIFVSETPLALDLTLADLRAAAERIKPVAHRTPVLTSRRLNELTGADVFIKAEHLRRTGSFKIRGAYNAIASLSPSERAKGIAAFSSGNHAQAVAHSAQMHGVPAMIVMPHDAPPSKRAATEGYGAEVIEYERGMVTRESVTADLAAERGMTLIKPFDDLTVITGQGTVGVELFDEIGPLDILLVCAGGGGLTSGCALAARELSPDCLVYGVEPAAGDDIKQSIDAGHIIEIDVPNTIADGQMTTAPGKHTFDVISSLVEDILLVTDDEILDAMDWAFRFLNQVVEPSGASAFAALLAQKLPVEGKRVGVTFSGGNIDTDRFVDLMSGRTA
jgi:threo-3-hydroxy-L-aspartate ammonia-lyase